MGTRDYMEAVIANINLITINVTITIIAIVIGTLTKANVIYERNI